MAWYWQVAIYLIWAIGAIHWPQICLLWGKHKYNFDPFNDPESNVERRYKTLMLVVVANSILWPIGAIVAIARFGFKETFESIKFFKWNKVFRGKK